jgi:phosphopantothenoylcysteine decarboxylase/phosphopantothenate--cysteine ligase
MAKCVVLGITGGIAAYKSAEVVSRLTKAGVDVYCIMTRHAQEFITPLTLETLSKHPVVVDMFDRDAPWEVEHIALAQRADVFAVVPATANILAKMAHGLADDMLSTTIMATRAPIVLAPAMNTNMWEHVATQQNMQVLRQRGCIQVGPGSGLLACGDIGLGRMAEPEEIVAAIMAALYPVNDYAGKTVLVTAGPTREPIDPVRFITNRSSGKMGYAIAAAAAKRGAKVILVSGPVDIPVPTGVEKIDVETTQEMLEAVVGHYEQVDVVIKAAAPSDYRPAQVADQKIKKKAGEPLVLSMVENPDIAAELGRKKNKQILVTFAAETEHMLDNARAKLERKNADLMVANDVTQPGAGFDVDTNVVTLITSQEQVKLPCLPKTEVAQRILDKVSQLFANRE